MRKRWKFASTIVFILAAALFLFWEGGGLRSRHPAVAKTSAVLDGVFPSDVQQAFDAAADTQKVSEPAAAVLPHYLPAKALLAGLVQSIRSSRPKTIVLIGPDHQNLGSRYMTTTLNDWQSSGVRYAINKRVVKKLSASPFVSAGDAVIADEHSVLIPLPFLAKQFPDAHFVLLTVRGRYDQNAIHDVTDRLISALDARDLVIASVDFSHYQPLAAAEIEDATSRAAIVAGNPDALATIPADSPASLAIAMGYAQRRGAHQTTIVGHTNSALILGDPTLASTTSFFAVVFHP